MKIGCDIDGTICNTMPVVYRTFFDEIDLQLLRQYDLSSYGADADYFSRESIYKKAKPYRGAAKILRALIAEGHDITFITARPQHLREVTEDWLYRYGFPYAELVMGKPKNEVIKRRGVEVMIEDAPHEVERLSGAARLIVLNRPYNQELKVTRANHWYGVPELV